WQGSLESGRGRACRATVGKRTARHFRRRIAGSRLVNSAAPWVVLKFGGTSVSTAQNWRNIAGVVRDRIAANLRPVVVHSALSGITDRLEALLGAALTGNHAAALERIETTHRDLAASLGISPGERFERFFEELRRTAAAVAQQHLLEDRVRARVMAMGELLATSLGEAFLN